MLVSPGSATSSGEPPQLVSSIACKLRGLESGRIFKGVHFMDTRTMVVNISEECDMYQSPAIII